MPALLHLLELRIGLWLSSHAAVDLSLNKFAFSSLDFQASYWTCLGSTGMLTESMDPISSYPLNFLKLENGHVTMYTDTRDSSR